MMASFSLILLLALSIMLVSSPAYAYIDPGTGSLVIQGAIAAVVGAGVIIKLFWHKIVAVLTGKPIQEGNDDDE